MDILPLSDADRIALEQQLLEADRIIRSKLTGRKLTGRTTDLRVLQELLDTGTLRWDIPAEIEPVELAVGRLMIVLEAAVQSVESQPLQWCVAIDEYGRRLAVKHRDYDAVINPLDVLAKRLERGDKIKLSALISDLVSLIQDEIEAGGVRKSGVGFKSNQ